MGFVGSRSEFIKKYGSYIKQQVKGTGILPGTLITQLIVESQGKVGGTYKVGGSKLAREANNYFGIKCGGYWSGKKYTISTREETKNGETYYTNACFRKYNSIEDSIKDYIKYIQTNQRYRSAGFFNEKTVLGQFQALKAAGYATGNNYVSLLYGVYKPLALQIDNIETKSEFKKAVIPLISVLAAMFYIYNKDLK